MTMRNEIPPGTAHTLILKTPVRNGEMPGGEIANTSQQVSQLSMSSRVSKGALRANNTAKRVCDLTGQTSA